MVRRSLWLLPLLLACGDGPERVGTIVVIAQAQTATMHITRVTVTVSPAGITRDLAVDPQDPARFTSTVSAPVGPQTLTVEARNGDALVGTGSASVMVAKGATVQAQIRILDGTGPATGPDHSPVVTSLVTPASAQVDDQVTLTATAMDADADAMTFSWTASPEGCGNFADAAALSTAFTVKASGTCTVRFAVTANGKTDSRDADILVALATGSLEITVNYVPQPVISSIAFAAGQTAIASVARDATDGTIRAPFHQGTAYTVTVSFDPWPVGSLTLSDSCAGNIVQPAFVPNATSANATWTPTVDTGACVITASLTRESLSDSFFVVVLPAP